MGKTRDLIDAKADLINGKLSVTQIPSVIPTTESPPTGYKGVLVGNKIRRHYLPTDPPS